MKSSPRRLPSPALVIACVALFLSLGGVSYGVATGFIDSREIDNNTIRSKDVRNNALRSKDVRNNTLRTFDIRNNEVRGFDIRNSSVQGRDVAFDTLTGADIDEGELGKVPSAGAADTAAAATTAGTVAGVTMSRIRYAAEGGSGFADIFNMGGLTLQARCTALNDIEVRGLTANPEAELDSSFPSTAALVVNAAGAGVIAFADPGGAIVTVQGLAVEDPNDVQGSTNDCGFFGIAEVG